ncbi:hypothetical protein A5742_17655 [Mycolicibacterium fortuitum]|uniref:Uncharacterized protein n=1 Tax=Mycolicibacterium fortuitum TaxID=1766 RepID=A0ABD6QT76_MYCFO|nr:hypothetical protein [Mycolicibacterium fortuitum]OMC51958.1 hypothetical protein A5742_17655 [Mycolicibacterium fortuitum]
MVLLACWGITSLLVCAGFIVNHEGEPIPAGETVRLVMVCLAFWGPLALATLWPVSVPLIAGLTALVAYAHAGMPEEPAKDDDQAVDDRS